MSQQNVQLSTLQTRSLSDWQVDNKNKSAQHRSGLIIQVDNRSGVQNRLAALDISGLENLLGTPWASRPNVLIEEGISLLTANG